MAAGLAVLIVAGCVTVGPDYIRPETPLPPVWHTQLQRGLTTAEMDPENLAAWWTGFKDPQLSHLIEQALAGNLDLKKARARVREARARRGTAQAAFFPTLDASGSVSWGRTIRDTGSSEGSDLYSAGFDAGWELDIFGGLRRSVEAAEADLQAVREEGRDTLVSLLAETALNYVEVRTLQAERTALEANLATQDDTFRLVAWRQQAGLSDDLAVQQARYNLENTRSQIPVLRTSLEEALNRLAVLLGEQPGKIHEEMEKQVPIPVPPLRVAVGLPADTLRRRPDVRRTEQELAAQTARVGVATADLYPKFSLSGSIGLEAHSLPALSSSALWTLLGGPRITWPLFRGGALRQKIEVQSALQEQALIRYEATVLQALEEVENVLTAYAEEQIRGDSLGAAEEAAAQAATLAQHKYEAGLTDFTSVLEAQRSLRSFQYQRARSRGTVAANLIRLYKTLGGGWESLAVGEQP